MTSHKVALSRPDWIRFYGNSLRRILKDEKEVTKFFIKLWDRMKELKLIKEPAFPAEDAARHLSPLDYTRRDSDRSSSVYKTKNYSAWSSITATNFSSCIPPGIIASALTVRGVSVISATRNC